VPWLHGQFKEPKARQKVGTCGGPLLAAAGHGESDGSTPSRPKNPGGPSHREAEVLRLAARGFTTQEIADRLFISPKTADHHIQHIYNKITVSTRAAAALWAMQNSVVQ
jgi:DNA-binding CsgD family transcriptional regulator